MKTITFFRLEDSSGKGVYSSENGVYSDECSHYKEDKSRHPEPQNDSLIQSELEKETGFPFNEVSIWGKTYQKFLYGFSSLAQLRAWFYDNRVLQYFHETGFTLSCAEVPAIAGNSQAMCLEEIWRKADKIEIDILALLS